MTDARWSWCAECSFPNRRRFIFGNVFTNKRDAWEEARQMLLQAMAETFVSVPEIHAVLPGAVVLVQRDA